MCEEKKKIKKMTVKNTVGAHVLDFIDIKAIEVHNNYEYLTL